MLEEKIRLDLTEALKKKSTVEVSTLRFLLAEIRNCWIQKQAELTDEGIVLVIRQQVKLRQEAIEAYEKAARNDLAEKEKKELAILSKYLPQKFSKGELEKLVRETIAEMGATGPKDFSKVMGIVMRKVKGCAEGATVAELVRKLL